MQQTRVLAKPTAPTEGQEEETVSKTKEVVVETVKKEKVKRADLPLMDREVVNKLKQEAGSTIFTTTSFERHTRKIDKATFNRNSGRLCYWCVEEECLKKRLKKWCRENPNRKHADYATFRQQLDKSTKSECPRYLEITTRKPNWPRVNTETKRKLMTYVKMAPFEEIMESNEHRKNVNEMTYMTTSDHVCYWCLTEECLHVRRFHTNPEYTRIQRRKLDSKTMNR